MPKTQSAAKRLRQAERRKQLNRRWSKAIKACAKAVRAELTHGERLDEATRRSQSLIDRAAAKGQLHWRKAARLKSQLVHQLRKRAVNELLDGLQEHLQRAAESPVRVRARREKWRQLRREYPNKFIAYRERWDGDRLVEPFVLAAGDSESQIADGVHALPSAEGEQATIAFVAPPGRLFLT